MEWAGQYDQLKDEQKRLAKIVPLSLLLILLLLYITFDSLKNALLVLSAVPFALIGGVIALVATHTNFSISAAVGIISTLGVAILGGVLLISRIEDGRQAGLNLREAIMQAAAVQMRPILDGNRRCSHRPPACSSGHRDWIAGPKAVGQSRGRGDADRRLLDSGSVAGVI